MSDMVVVMPARGGSNGGVDGNDGGSKQQQDLALQQRVRAYDTATHDANLRAAFAVIDTDGSGTITVHEMGVFARAEGYTVSDEQLEEIFAGVDEDDDHSTLSFEEFVLVMNEVEGGATGLGGALHGFLGSIMELQQTSRPLYEQMQEDNDCCAGTHAQWRIKLGAWIERSTKPRGSGEFVADRATVARWKAKMIKMPCTRSKTLRTDLY